jgi:hypothetical protein
MLNVCSPGTGCSASPQASTPRRRSSKTLVTTYCRLRRFERPIRKVLTASSTMPLANRAPPCWKRRVFAQRVSAATLPSGMLYWLNSPVYLAG